MYRMNGMHLMYWVNGAGYIGDMFFGERHPQNQNPFAAHNKAILMLNTERLFFFDSGTHKIKTPNDGIG